MRKNIPLEMHNCSNIYIKINELKARQHYVIRIDNLTNKQNGKDFNGSSDPWISACSSLTRTPLSPPIAGQDIVEMVENAVFYERRFTLQLFELCLNVNNITTKTQQQFPKIMVYLKGVVSHLSWLKIHQTKRTTYDYHQPKGFQDKSTYTRYMG